MSDSPNTSDDTRAEAAAGGPPDYERAHPFLDRLAVGVAGAIGLLPWRFWMIVGQGLGFLAVPFLGRKNYRMRHNLAGIDGAGRNLRPRKVWSQLAQTFLEMMWMTGKPPDRILRYVRVEGLDVMRQATAEGRGVLLVGGHLGNWELGGPTAKNFGKPSAAVAKPLKSPGIEKLIVDYREKCGVTTLVRGEGGSGMAAYRWLVRGNVLFCLMDRASSGMRRLVPFLANAVNVPLGPAIFASRCGSPVVFCGVRREEDGTSVVSYRRLPTTSSSTPEEIVDVIAATIEEEVRRAPEQWYWIYRRQPEWEGEHVVSGTVADRRAREADSSS